MFFFFIDDLVDAVDLPICLVEELQHSLSLEEVEVPEETTMEGRTAMGSELVHCSLKKVSQLGVLGAYTYI